MDGHDPKCATFRALPGVLAVQQEPDGDGEEDEVPDPSASPEELVGDLRGGWRLGEEPIVSVAHA